jgi:hypothetical protein
MIQPPVVALSKPKQFHWRRDAGDHKGPPIPAQPPSPLRELFTLMAGRGLLMLEPGREFLR